MDKDKSNQWTGQWIRVVNGVTISENFTGRFDTYEELEFFRDESLKKAPTTASFPNDEGPVAHAPSQVQKKAPICPIHNIPKTWKEGGVSKSGKAYKGFWACPEKNENGSFCRGREI